MSVPSAELCGRTEVASVPAPLTHPHFWWQEGDAPGGAGGVKGVSEERPESAPPAQRDPPLVGCGAKLTFGDVETHAQRVLDSSSVVLTQQGERSMQQWTRVSFDTNYRSHAILLASLVARLYAMSWDMNCWPVCSMRPERCGFGLRACYVLRTC